MQNWQGFRFHHLVEVPQPAKPQAGEDADDTTNALYTALTGAHAELLASAEREPLLATAWVRPPQGRQLMLLLGGRPHFPPAIGSPATPQPASARRRVLFPPGAVAQDLPMPEVRELFDQFGHWVACVARADSLWVQADHKSSDTVRRGAFDRYAAHLREPFAWLVLAQPLRPGEIQPELDQLVNEILPLTRGEVNEAKKVGLERRQARHRELSRFADGGTWRVRLLVGGVDPRSAGIAAAMLCAASELEGLPYVLAPTGPATRSRESESVIAGTDFIASTDLLVALTRPPARELAGLRLVAPHSFDLTPEAGEPGGIHLGSVIDEAAVDVGDMLVNRSGLVRHTFVCGATGSGKSHTVRHLLAQASRHGLPWLAVEPAKAEYARMAARLAPFGGDVIVLRPSHPDRPPAGLNPLEPARGFPLQTHADLLRALFLASFEAQEPFPQILAAAIQRCYEELGWDLTLGTAVHKGARPRYPTLGDLQRVAQDIVDEIGYSREISDNVRGFIKVRLNSLRLGTTGRFFEGGHPIDFARLLTRNVVLEIEDVGDDADKAFFMGIILMRLAEHLRVNRDSTASTELRHLTVVEEAHRLLRRPEPGAVGPAAHAVEMFAAMLAEVRAYGEGLIVAEQIPSKLIPDVIKNTAVKIVHRLPAQDDRESVGATMNLDERQSKYLVTLRRGDGAVFTDGMDRPVLIRIPDGTTLEDGPANTAPVAGIIEWRSLSCGRECQAEPCTLRQMRTAQHVVGTETWLGIWAELTVVAHLCGSPMPRPDKAVLDTLVQQGHSGRTLDCAISHAVDDAVAVRSTVLQPLVSPIDLAVHASGAMRAVLAGASDPCADDALAFLSTPLRWERVRLALAAARDTVGRHPRTEEWQTQFRRMIPGDSCLEQLIAVACFLAEEMQDRERLDAMTFGARRPSTLEHLMGGFGDGWTGRVLAQLESFEPAKWPLYYLTPQSEPDDEGGSDE